MDIAILFDVHSNFPALEAALSDIERQRVDRVLHGGDLVGYGSFLNEVIHLVKARNILGVVGNYDDGVGFERNDCGCAYRNKEQKQLGHRSLEWTKTKVINENKNFLRNLPNELRVSYGAFKVLLVHGSPRRINEYLYEDRPDRTFTRLLEIGQCNVFVCGHTHLPYYKTINGKHVINVGSVGKPKDGDPQAAYALFTLHENVSVNFRRVPYDVERTVRAIEASELPNEFAKLLRRDWDRTKTILNVS